MLSLRGSVFAVAVGAGAGGGQLGGGCSGVVAAGTLDLAGSTTAVTVGAGGAAYQTMGTVGYNGGDNNLADDVAATNGGASIIGSLTAGGGEQAENGSGGSGGGHYGTPTGNSGGTGGADGNGPCCYGLGQGAAAFQSAITLIGLADVELQAGAGGAGGFRDNPGESRPSAEQRQRKSHLHTGGSSTRRYS